jgi:hypothetical protein
MSRPSESSSTREGIVATSYRCASSAGSWPPSGIAGHGMVARKEAYSSSVWSCGTSTATQGDARRRQTAGGEKRATVPRDGQKQATDRGSRSQTDLEALAARTQRLVRRREQRHCLRARGAPRGSKEQTKHVGRARDDRRVDLSAVGRWLELWACHRRDSIQRPSEHGFVPD